MLIALLLGIGGLGTAAYFLSGRKLYSPSFLLCAVFFVCTLFAILGNTLYWHEPVSSAGPLIIFVSLLLIVLFQYLAHLLASKVDKKKKPLNVPLPTFELNRGTKIFLLVIFVIGLIVNILFFKAALDIAIAAGYKPFNLNFFGFIRGKLGAIDTRLSLANNCVRGLGIGCLYFAIYGIFSLKHKRQIWFFFPPILNLFVSFFLSTSRDVFILLAVVAVLSFLITLDKRKIKIKKTKMLIIIASIVAVFLLFFVISGYARGGTSGAYTSQILKTLCNYSGSSIIAFDKWLRQSPPWSRNSLFGDESFYGVYYILNKLFPSSVPNGTNILEFTHFIDGSGTNIYTVFRSFYADFGIIGDLVLSSLIGAAYGIIFYFQRRAGERSPFLLYAAIVIFYLLYGAFTPVVTCSLFGAVRLMTLFFSLGAFEGLRFFIFGEQELVLLSKFRKSNGKYTFKKNVIFALVAELIVMIVGAFASLLLPKFIGEDSFNYYQLFTFYIGYVGLAHLGFCDGVYLRFGGKNEQDVKDSDTKTQFFVFTISQIVFGILVSLGSLFFIQSAVERTFTLLFVAVYLVVYNLVVFLGYIFQDMNEASVYSFSTILGKGFFLFSIVVLFFLGITSPFAYIGCFVFGTILSLCYLIVKGRNFLFGKPHVTHKLVADMFVSLKCGIVLLLANLSNTLILGIARYMIDWHWGIKTFGKFSFALSLVGLVSAFFTSFSLVLFPSLKLKKDNQISDFFERADKILSVLLPLSFLLYYLAFVFVQWWLPAYQDSLVYFALLLPTVLFTAKYTIIYRTSLNVSMREKSLLFINLAALIVSTIFSAISTYALNNVILTILSAVLGISVLGISGKLVTDTSSKKKVWMSIIMDVVLSAAFIAINYWVSALWLRFVSVLVLLVLYYLLTLPRTIWFVKYVKDLIKKKKEQRKLKKEARISTVSSDQTIS